jgi:hypothetical protein
MGRGRYASDSVAGVDIFQIYRYVDFLEMPGNGIFQENSDIAKTFVA